MHIASTFWHLQQSRSAPRRRKLLLTKRELRKLIRGTKETGFTIVPTKLFINEGLAKLEIGLARGRKLTTKRQT